MAAMRHLLWPGLGLAGVLVAVVAMRWALMAVLRRWARGPGALAAFLHAVRVPSLLWCVVIALYVTIEVARRAGAGRALDSRLRGFVARLHADLSRRDVRGPVSGAARAAQAHSSPVAGRAHRGPVSGQDGDARARSRHGSGGPATAAAG